MAVPRSMLLRRNAEDTKNEAIPVNAGIKIKSVSIIDELSRNMPYGIDYKRIKNI
jgi:hypothetical protein